MFPWELFNFMALYWQGQNSISKEEQYFHLQMDTTHPPSPLLFTLSFCQICILKKKYQYYLSIKKKQMLEKCWEMSNNLYGKNGETFQFKRKPSLSDQI